MLREFSFQKKLQAMNVVMKSFEWKQNEHKILASIVCLSKFPRKHFQLTDLPQQHEKN